MYFVQYKFVSRLGLKKQITPFSRTIWLGYDFAYKKFELMLMRCVKAYSSSGSVV